MANGAVVHNCQTLPADSFWQVVMACANAYYRFGFSATPFARGDRKGLLAVAAIGPTIFRISQKTLVNAGAIAKATIHLVPHALARADAVALQKSGLAYVHAYDEIITYNATRNATILAIAKQMAKPGFVFVRSLEHGRTLERMFTAAGVSTEFVWGAKNTHQREAAVRRLVHGDTDIIVCNVIFQAGIDVPELMSVLNAAGGKSHITALQQAGRGSRRRTRTGAIAKDAFSVYDIDDHGCGCKGKSIVDGKSRWQHKVCEWLEKHARSRRKAFLSEGYSVLSGSLA